MIVVVCGPTASSKSKIAQELSKLLDAVIINGDAFQVYEELLIGVNKPNSQIIKTYNYKLIDFLPLESSFSIADFQELGRQVIESKLEQKRNIVIEGGSGLYLKSLLFDYDFSKKPTQQKNYEEFTNDELYSILSKIDPESLKTIHLNNRKRLIRALQIHDETGCSKTEMNSKQNHAEIYPDIVYVALNVPREELYDKINKRVDVMWSKGLKEEVQNLIKTYPENLQSLQAIGYKEVIVGMKSGETDEQIKENIRKNTRNYAKRQITYFKHQLPVKYFDTINDIVNFVREFKDG